MSEYKCYKGMIMFLGMFRIRRDVAYLQEISGSPYLDQMTYINRLEPILRKFCTIKWVEIDPITEPETCYY